MENTIHAKKVAILSRLIKESSLTLEEALVLLEEEQAPVSIPWQQPINTPSFPSTNPYWITTPNTGTITTLSGISGGSSSSTTYTSAQAALTSLFGDSTQTD